MTDASPLQTPTCSCTARYHRLQQPARRAVQQPRASCRLAQSLEQEEEQKCRPMSRSRGHWLRHWADSERDVHLDDSSLLCPHGDLDLTSIPDAKHM
ncbi:hypothetical protein WJX73_001849 [Symbiochloris irregularis]|uniref:Uncharacterized protein n=1 Tax=Symbiochloris irregularis TaxID=706552 RepID=A0AAW1NX41_9CHLO